MQFNPTPRKLHKLTPLEIGKMQVISINDFDRAQEAQLEYIMESAVDQLEGFNKPAGERPTVADVTIYFGQLRLHDELPPQFRFDYEPPTTCRQWPGPRFGSFSLHKPLPSTKTKAKSKGSKQPKKHVQPDDFKQSIRPLKAPKPKKTKKKADVAPALISTKTSRDPPLDLMSLPPELRNAVWSLLAVHDEPLEVQLRPIRPCKRPKELRGAIIRRFPLEPVVASVSRQVRREVLSIFYGDNRFILQHNGGDVYNGRIMTDPAVMEKWLPRQSTAKFLTHVDIRFSAMPRTFIKSMGIVYSLRRMPDNAIKIVVKVERAPGKTVPQQSRPCICMEQEVVTEIERGESEENVMEIAVKLARKRRDVLFPDHEWERGSKPFLKLKKITCEKCMRETFANVNCC